MAWTNISGSKRRRCAPDRTAPSPEVEDARTTTPADHLTIEARQGDRGCLVRLAGELDSGAAPRLQSTLEPWVRNCRRLTLDLRQVTFLDSAGLHVILDLYRRLREREVSLHLLDGSQGNVPRVLRHAGLESLIDGGEDERGH
jgi:anti-sigma B factor antagonist